MNCESVTSQFAARKNEDFERVRRENLFFFVSHEEEI